MSASVSSSEHQLFGVDRRVLALAFARMADALGNSFLIIVLPLYIASGTVTGDVLGMTEAMITGVVLAVFGIASSLTQPFAGRLSDTVGVRKEFVLGGLLVFCVANVSFVWADEYWILFIIRIVQGLAAAFTITASIALVNEMSEVSSRGGNMGVYNAFRLVGFGAGPIAASVMVEAGPFALPVMGTVTGFEAAFYIAAGAYSSPFWCTTRRRRRLRIVLWAFASGQPTPIGSWTPFLRSGWRRW